MCILVHLDVYDLGEKNSLQTFDNDENNSYVSCRISAWSDVTA